MAEADNLIDKAVNRVEFAALIISLVKTLNDDKDLADSVRAAVQSTRGVPVNFDERTTSGDLMKKLVKAGLHEHSDDHIAVAEPVKRLVKKGYSTGGRCQAVADLFQLHTLPIPSTDDGDDVNTLSRFPKMRTGATRRGHAIILNVETYENAAHNRRGSQMDVAVAKALLEWLYFEVTCLWDVQGNIQHQLECQLGQLDFTDTDWFFCFLMSHGVDNMLISSNMELVDMEDIFQLIRRDDVCHVLAESDLPKLFFVEACRNPLRSASLSSRASLSSSHHQYRKHENLLCSYATRHGENAHRFPEHGSLYVRIVDECFREFVPQRRDVMQILVAVNARCQEEELQTAPGGEIVQQTPPFECSMSKLMYLDYRRT